MTWAKCRTVKGRKYMWMCNTGLYGTTHVKHMKATHCFHCSHTEGQLGNIYGCLMKSFTSDFSAGLKAVYFLHTAPELRINHLLHS